MEFLQNPIVSGLIGLVGVPALIYFVNLFMPRKSVYDFGFKIMGLFMAFTFEHIGEKPGRAIINNIGNTLTDLTSGMHDATVGVKNESYPN